MLQLISCSVCLVVRCMHGGVAYTAKTFGLLLPHFRLSKLHQCDQGMLPNRFFESSLRNVFSSISYLAGILNTTTMQPTIQGQLCRIKETTNLTKNADYIHVSFLKGDTNLTKEGSFSTKLFEIVSIP